MKGTMGRSGTWSFPPEIVIFAPEAGTVGLALDMADLLRGRES
jgi:hypothetical protein